MKKYNTLLLAAAAAAGLICSTTACNDSKSYAELLTEEGQAINNYLVCRFEI